MNRNQQTIKDLIENCRDFTTSELEALDQWQLDVIDSTDTNWCYEADALTWNDSIEEAVSKALFASYEQVTAPNATEDNF